MTHWKHSMPVPGMCIGADTSHAMAVLETALWLIPLRIIRLKSQGQCRAREVKVCS